MILKTRKKKAFCMKQENIVYKYELIILFGFGIAKGWVARGYQGAGGACNCTGHIPFAI